MDMFSTAEINGYYLFAAPAWAVYVGVVAALVGVAYATYLMSADQPTPIPAEWSKNR